MANRTVKDAKSIKGTNPQYLIEKIIRSRIYDSKYWKEECFALTAELVVDKAMELKYVGGVFGGNVKPTPFLCLTLKMLQIQPEKEIIVEFIKNSDFKYVRALGAYYMRLTGTSLDCYKYLEPLLNDNRKLRRQNRNGGFELVYMDEFVDELLREERSCDVILPRMQKRQVLEELNELQPRVSLLDDEDEEGEDLDDDDEVPASSKAAKKDDRGSSKKDRKRRGRSESESSSSSSEGDKKRRSNKGRDTRRDTDRRRRSRSRSRERRNYADRHSRRHERDYSPRDKDRNRDRDRKSYKDYDRKQRPENFRRRSRSRSRDREKLYDRRSRR